MLFHRHLVLNSAGTLYYCRCSILSVFYNRSSSGIAFSYRRSSACAANSTSTASNCKRLTTTALFLAFLNSSSVLFVVAKVWFGESAVRSVAYRHRARNPFNFRFFVRGTAFCFRSDGTERKRHRFFWRLLY